jgi:ribonuclease HI
MPHKKIVINTDGGARGNPGPAGIGVVFFDENQKIIGEFNQYIGSATNNTAEYKALILALQKAAVAGAQELEVRMDSELIVRQMQGRYKIKEPGLKILAAEVLKLIKKFHKVEFCHVPRELNKEADKLVNEAIDKATDND